MPKKPKFQSLTGMHDVLPNDQKYFQKIYNVCENMAKFYGFRKIDTPILEDANLFSKGVGLTTDIVQKEMYTVKARGGDIYALRPEGTASIVRSFIQHGMFNLPQPVKLWYWGPFFRAEKPQAGRYRQFSQFGFEVLGEKSSVIDAQIIHIFYNIYKELGFKDLVVEVNSIGDNQCRPYYKKTLVSYLRSKESSMCSDCKKRFKKNPLRVLDCKEEKCQEIKAQAPQILDHLCEECHNHFKEVLEFLDETGLPYQLNPYLVRGLDYYTKTVFEIMVEPVLDKEKDSKEEKKKVVSLAGGGRFDSLIKLLGGEEIPATGAAGGVERTVLEMKARKMKFSEEAKPKIFLTQIGDMAKRKGLKIFEDFRKAKIFVAESFGKDSLKIQLAKANKLGVKYVLILGQKEVVEGVIIIRDMASGKQETVKTERIVKEMKKRLKK